MAATKVSLKLLIDTKGERVLFAEAGKDFVDFLFHILSLPVGTVVRLLSKESMVGCLGALYGSIENLSEIYMQPNQTKDSVLMPKAPRSAPEVPLLLPREDEGESSSTRELYRCVHHDMSAANRSFGSLNKQCHEYAADDPRAVCPSCNNLMGTKLKYVAAPPAVTTTDQARTTSSGEGGYVKGVVTYMVMDDLVVKPMSTISSITLLNSFNVKELGALEEKVVDVTMDEGVKLLKFSLQSKAVLTDVFLGKKQLA
uniref:DUF674 domain-containing protein n=1 Tax=Davidia involucrata TaxID=16924 RepID=A0A5B6YHG8_DAVIN